MFNFFAWLDEAITTKADARPLTFAGVALSALGLTAAIFVGSSWVSWKLLMLLPWEFIHSIVERYFAALPRIGELNPFVMIFFGFIYVGLGLGFPFALAIGFLLIVGGVLGYVPFVSLFSLAIFSFRIAAISARRVYRCLVPNGRPQSPR